MFLPLDYKANRSTIAPDNMSNLLRNKFKPLYYNALGKQKKQNSVATLDKKGNIRG